MEGLGEAASWESLNFNPRGAHGVNAMANRKPNLEQDQQEFKATCCPPGTC
jgi:hypothetical protein